MANFGFHDLVLVGAPVKEIDPSSLWWACGAEEMVREARKVDTLEEALAGCHLTVATTAIRGRHVHEQLTPADVARIASSELGTDHRLGVVFGRERWGLSGREIALCQRTASVPTSPETPTMNLAQTVGVFCYELGKGAPPADKHSDPAPAELLHNLNAQARALLDEIGYFGDRNPDNGWAELNSIAGKRMLTTREASVLLAIIRRIQARFGR